MFCNNSETLPKGPISGAEGLHCGVTPGSRSDTTPLAAGVRAGRGRLARSLLAGAVLVAATSASQLAGSATGDFGLDSTAAAAPSRCVTLQPAKHAGTDSYIKSNSATSNFGNDAHIAVKTKVTASGQISELKRGLIEFDLSAIPANVVIDSADLKLAVDAAPKPNTGGLDVSVHRIATAWSESTVTWNTPWSTPGGDFDSTPITTQNIDENDKFSALGNQRLSFDVTSGVAYFAQNPASNFGFLLKGPDTLTGDLDREVKFWSNDEKNAGKRPVLEVCYSAGMVLEPDNSSEASAGDTVVYGHTLTIGDLAGTANEMVTLALVSSAGWSPTPYLDVNNNGTYEPGTDTQIIGPLSLAQNSTTKLLIVTQVPAVTPDGTIDQTTITATGSPSGIGAIATDTTSVGIPPFIEPVVDGKLDSAYLTNPDAVMQEYCAAPGSGVTGVLARTFTTFDPANEQSPVFIVLEMDLAMVDNTYGSPPSLHPSWTAAGKAHSLGSLTGSDEAEFNLYGANGSLVANPIVDYSEAATGYHPGGIELNGLQPGQIVAKSSIGYNFTTLGYTNTTNSPALTATLPTDPYIPVDPQWSDWQFEYLYELSIGKDAFDAAGGFGDVSIPYTHVSPNKLGSNVIDSEPCAGSIGDRVWHDLNSDGVQDAGEPGLNGVLIELYADNGDGVFNPATDYPRGIRVTSGDGEYLFDGLGPGKFWVNVVDSTVPAGFFITTNNDPFGIIDLGLDEDFLDADFGYNAFDFGDLPDAAGGPAGGNPYPTLLEHDGARHVATGVLLGVLRDVELDGQPNPNATGDDLAGQADEDGVNFTDPLSPSKLFIAVEVTSSAAGVLNAWIDFNADGDFADAGEQIFTNVALVAGANALSFPTPAYTANDGQPRYVRFRVTDLAGQGGDSPSGMALSGEVEDYVYPAGPTAVELVYFKGYQVQKGGAAVSYVEWKTANEIDTLGFEVYRWDRRSGGYALVGVVIPATGPDSVYSLQDKTGASLTRNTYLLRELTTSGFNDLPFEDLRMERRR